MPQTSESRRPARNDHSTATERELLAMVRSGDDDAFAEIYRRLAPEARRYARRHVGSLDVDDAVAETFANVLQALRRGRGPVDEPLPYVLFAVRTTAWRQRRASRSEMDKALRVAPAEPWSTDAGQLGDDDLHVAFEALCQRHRQVIWWSAVEGLSATEIGEALGVSANAAAALTYRARRALRDAYTSAELAAAS